MGKPIRLFCVCVCVCVCGLSACLSSSNHLPFFPRHGALGIWIEWLGEARQGKKEEEEEEAEDGWMRSAIGMGKLMGWISAAD